MYCNLAKILLFFCNKPNNFYKKLVKAFINWSDGSRYGSRSTSYHLSLLYSMEWDTFLFQSNFSGFTCMMAPGKKRKADPKDKEVAQGATKRRQSVNRALQRASRSLSRVTSNRSVDDGIGRVNEQQNFTHRTRKNVSGQQTDDTDFSDSDLEQPVDRGRRRGTKGMRQIALGTVNRNSVGESKSKEKGTSSVRMCQSAPGTVREKRGQVNNEQNIQQIDR